MTPRRRRMLMIGGVLFGVAAAAFFAVQAIRENATYFVYPTEVAAGEVPDRAVRLGGLVAVGSVMREPGSLTVRFGVTDCAATVPVIYERVLPDLFREGQGVVVRGEIDDTGTMLAAEVLAKHDENYIPRDVAEAVAGGRARGGDACEDNRLARAPPGQDGALAQ